ncbi:MULTISPECIES: autotransporter domain-containing protein [unclassified Methylobacterium]|uniref:autotransporter domain-containing protein n=1 Tax=unclassified Methylobacterium TaxID=2615210 RepID=UPI002269F701|nr:MULTISPECIES: autotransporter domain-containing protein [unclassified Methylobacterium]
MKAPLIRALLTSTMFVAVTSVAQAQSLYVAAPTPDQPTAPTYPSSAPNNGQPIASVRAITGFGTVYGFGSSSTNTRLLPTLPYATEYYSNGHAIYTEILSPLIGARYVPGNTFPGATGLANGGSTSTSLLFGSPVGCTINVNCTLTPQIAQFQQAYGRFAPNDVVVHWGATNDFNNTVISSLAVEAQVRDRAIAQQTTAIQQLIGLGARNIVFVSQSDLGALQLYNVISPNASALLTAAARETNAGSYANLVALHRQTGVNIHYFDQDLLVSQIRANPTAYGFSAEGVRPNATCVTLFPTLNANTTCGKASFAEQNKYLSFDGIHWTYRFHDIQGQAIANQLIAPYTIAPQVEIADAGARAFANSLLLRLDAYRAQNTPTVVGANFAADLPGRAAAPVPTAILLGNPVSLFAEGGFAAGGRDSRQGAPGFDYDAASVTVGAEYRARPDLLLGAAFNYSNPYVNLTSLGSVGATQIDVNSYQFAGFASLNRPDWFADLVVGYGFTDFDVTRAGVIDQIQSNPHGQTVLAAAKAAYLFDLGPFRVGPVGTLTYAHTWIDAYSERGDPLLTQAVRQQSTDGLTGGAGVQVRLPFTLGDRLVSPFVNVTAEHDFLGHLRTITTAQTNTLALPINTSISGYDGRTYGKVAAGLSVDLGGGLSAMVNGSATFERAAGNDYGVNGGVRYRF